ncbi:SprT-like domain-containing protein [Limnobacter sp.]|uniref:SprT-like domain-containing protein n=1 Tax=Limnobacter sp. TaxID=2003368 RepID=UPI002590F547|nr:SprT-like domain-containing protein [Limnobacter sp.]
MSDLSSPSVQFYASLQRAFDFFNQSLFGGLLPNCLLTLRSTNRIYGYHHAKRFIAKNGDLMDELGLHPGYFSLRPIEMSMSTLVHEMVHHWQNHFGTPTKSNPHNSEWAQKMEEIGLMPTSTGLPGGERTGMNVTHYIKPDGHFAIACKALIGAGFAIDWFDRHAPVEPTKLTHVYEELEKQNLLVPMEPPPIKDIAQPKDTKTLPNKPVQTVSILSPAPKRVSQQVRMQCTGCGTKVTVSKQVKLICGECQLQFM